MNQLVNKLKSIFSQKKSAKRLAVSIVIFLEVIAISFVVVHAWVETVSSIKIMNENDTLGLIDTFVYTDVDITSQEENWTHTNGFIDLADYFKKSGDMHLAPASSSDGVHFYFPQVGTTNYRTGNVNDKNTTYMSVSFKLQAETNVDFFFYNIENGSGPTFTGNGEHFNPQDIRVSVTAYSEGTAPREEDTKIYAILPNNAATKTETVVNGTTSLQTGSASLKSFASSVKGTGSSNCIFSVGSDETKIVTVNLWLQSNATNMNGTDVLSENVTINNLGLISSLTPRHVTLVPGTVWRASNPTYYAWCFEANNGAADKLYKLKDNGDGTYSFDYPGNYGKMVFVRAKTNCSVDTGGTLNWKHSDNGGDVWNQTENTTVPDSPVDPTYFITSIDGSSQTWSDQNRNCSEGVWEKPAVIRLRYVDGQDTSWGTISGQYDGYTSAYDSANDVQEARLITRGSDSTDTYTFNANASVTNVSGQSYSNYAFVGWFTDVSGTTAATGFTATGSGHSVSSSRQTPEKGTDTAYYAKFKEVRTIKLIQQVDNAASTVGGTIYIDSTYGTSSVTKTVDKGATVEIHAVANPGYTFKGVYSTGNSAAGQKNIRNGIDYYTLTVSDNATYYAKFEANSHTVTASAGTGGEVTVGSSAQGTSSAASVKYNQTVSLVATPNGGYEFEGWYTDSGFTDKINNAGATYSYQLTVDNDVTVYAKFKVIEIYLGGWLNGQSVTTKQSAFKFTQDVDNDNLFSLTYTFTGNQAGYQYPVIIDGSNAYHPENHNAGSGTVGSTVNTSPGDDPKWKVNATSHDKVTFIWNRSSSTLTWSVTKYYYFSTSSCSWFKNDSCTLAISYNYGSYKDASTEIINDTEYWKIEIPASVTTFSLARHNSSGTYNAFDITKNGVNNLYSVNSSCSGGSWSSLN